MASPTLADVRLEIGGSLETVRDVLQVQVEIRNAGDAKAAPMDVEGELLGSYDTAHIEEGVGPRGSTRCTLRFPPAVPRPGLHALALDLRFGIQNSTVSRRGYLLLALGSNPEPVLRVSVAPTRLSNYGKLRVTVESTDGAAHRVRLRVLAVRGLNPQPPAQELAVPSSGPLTVDVALLRGTSLLEPQQAVLAVASVVDGEEERTSVASTIVEIVPHQPWLPRLRVPLLALTIGLLACALGIEMWWRWPRAGS